jgi:hypothetical protein
MTQWPDAPEELAKLLKPHGITPTQTSGYPSNVARQKTQIIHELAFMPDREAAPLSSLARQGGDDPRKILHSAEGAASGLGPVYCLRSHRGMREGHY